jgi:hypothetical protein
VFDAKLQTPRRRQIKQRMRPPEFEQHHGVMTRRLFRRPKGGFGVPRLNENAKFDIDPEQRQAASIGGAFMKGFTRLRNPDERLTALGSGRACKRKDKSHSGGPIAIIAGAEFVNGAAGKRHRSAGKLVRTRKTLEPLSFNISDAPPEPRKAPAAGDGLHPATSIFSYELELEQKVNFGVKRLDFGPRDRHPSL